MELAGDPWLLELALRGPGYRAVSALLLRMQILTARHWGHVIDMGDEAVRRRIASSARIGHVPTYPTSCLRCGCLALLNNWEAATDLRGFERQARIDFLLDSENPQDACFLQECKPQQQTEAVLAAIRPLLGVK